MKKPMMSSETQRTVKPLEPEPWKRGPTTRDLNPDLTPRGLTPFEYCVKHALAEEWPVLQKIVAARVVNEPTHVWQTCGKCGFVSQRAYRMKAGRPCINCNYPAYENGGFMADMSPAEITAYQAAKTKAEAEARERERRMALYTANENRAKAGLSPLTLAEFEAKQKADYQRRVENEQRAAATRAGRGDRMAAAGVLKSPRPDVLLAQGPAAAPVPKVHRKGA